jgi:hypothetical protein
VRSARPGLSAWLGPFRSPDKPTCLEETLDVMSNSRLVADIREALAELDTSAAQVLSKDEALRLIADQ